MIHQGSCHCGKIAYEVEGNIEQVLECNCSHCSRKGYLLWFGPKSALRLKTPESDLAPIPLTSTSSSIIFARCAAAHRLVSARIPGESTPSQ
jgi:hypothetical protein